MSIYRAYDIRGIYGSEITEELAEKIGKAFGSTLEGEIAVGRDMRTHSPKLSHSLIKGLTSTGLDVVDVGVVPTPLLYFAINHLGLAGGVMLTASHNPPEYNGFKLCRENAMTLYGDEIKTLGEAVEGEKFRSGEGSLKQRDIIGDYIEYVKERVKLEKKLKVVLDCANGTAGLVAPRLFTELGVDVTVLYPEPDGSFPNHPADPTVDENLKDLIDKVSEIQADLGFSYDGDADRAGFVTEDGQVIRGDQALALFSRQILAKNPGASIIYEVKCSQALTEDILAHGGKPIMYRTGHSYIKKKIKQENALMAGEMSGHFFFADDYPGYDDGIYATARMTKLLADSGKKMSEILDSIPKYYSTPEIKLSADEDRKFKLVEEVKKHFISQKDYEVVTVDGVRVQTKDGWALMRASNTSPKIILRFEGKTPEKLEQMKQMFKDVFEKYDELKGKL